MAEDSPRVEKHMNDQARPTDINVSPEQYEHIFKLYDDGLYLQAYRLAEAIGPLRQWRGTAARILAGRLAGNLGSMRLSDWHLIHAWRKDRTNPEAMWFFARYLLTMRGPLAAWKFVQESKFPADAPKDLQSHWCSQHAAILGRLRNFDAAEEWLRKAEAIGEEPWTCLEWAALYVAEDRHDEAEKAARRRCNCVRGIAPASNGSPISSCKSSATTKRSIFSRKLQAVLRAGPSSPSSPSCRWNSSVTLRPPAVSTNMNGSRRFWITS